ncbi:hypothetical protein VTL71DRAFT_9139 [Oculimacula yallundae]|uniref:C2H2-type domain-containing protein n=1 Tax=Oculimacula yallundae TaxID=86028 RepID=A0ABR4BTW0_9HELO
MTSQKRTVMKNPTMDSYTSKFKSGPNLVNKRSCSICGQLFTRTEHLTRHERSHRGEKPFQCSFCGFAFCRKDLLKRHISRQHSGVEYTTVTTDTSEASGGLDEESGSSKETNQFNFDSVFTWGSDMPGLGSMNSHGLSSINDIDLGNFMSDVYDGNSPLNFQVDGLLSPLSSNPHRETSPQLGFVTTSKTGNGSRATTLGTFQISEAKRMQLIDLGQEACSDMDLALPSCLTLERCVTACFDSLFTVTPCVHIPTWSAENADPCILLAMAACGARYIRQADLARSLQKVAREVTLGQIRTPNGVRIEQPPSVILALLIVTGFSLWNGPADACREAMLDNVLLAELSCLETSSDQDHNICTNLDPEDSWKAWVEKETIIRTRYSVFYYLSLVATAFDAPPPIRSSDIKLSLPCTETEWTASSAQNWARNRNLTARISLEEAVDGFLHSSVPTPILDSPFTAIIILHTLIQYWRQVSWKKNRDSEVAFFRNALRKLESAADFGSESTISPHNSRASLAYNFHSLLRLARIYLCANMGMCLSAFKTHTLSKISQAITVGFPIERSIEASQAALSATQSFAVLFKFGVAHTSGSGNLHYIFNTFQSALYLIKWLEATEKIPTITWTEHESETISSIESTVKEVELPPEQARVPLSQQVAFACLVIFKGANTWDLQTLLLEALHEYTTKSYAD